MLALARRNALGRPAATGLSPLDLGALALLALAPRLANLSRFSMWLDEIIETEQASGSLARLWRELRADAVHPPLEGLLSWLLLHLGGGEVARRAVAVGLGAAALLLLAAWVGRHFGRCEGLLVGGFLALAPLHVHYSQELRPYALAMCTVALALAAHDRLLARFDAARLATFWCAVFLCLASHYFAALVVVPIAWRTLEAAFGRAGREEAHSERRQARRLLSAAPLLVLGWGIASLPWLTVILAADAQRPQRPATRWTAAALVRRFGALTVGGDAGSALATAGAAVVLALVLWGIALAARRASGRTALAGLLSGVLGVELLLRWQGHWSEPRYDLIGWPWLAVPFALAGAALLRAARRTGFGAVVGMATYAVLVAAALAGLRADARARPDWRAIAGIIVATRAPGEPVFALNPSTRISIGYYLRERLGASADPPWLITVFGDAELLGRSWPADRAAVLVGRLRTPGHGLLRQARAFPLLIQSRATGVAVFHLTPEVRRRLDRAGGSPWGPTAPGSPGALAAIRPARSGRRGSRTAALTR